MVILCSVSIPQELKWTSQYKIDVLYHSTIENFNMIAENLQMQEFFELILSERSLYITMTTVDRYTVLKNQP
jgi:hypothetical protein